ncbi:four helix bundle protein [Marivirga harenae]|uniref:four helix bundle protein n=1 Tax=Marivirga harenae TaxID=2010992 RepID=UPI0026E07420|nr:four helix bundle protein [Marivirga harenae]WKV12835.1 four helix bundle protein [Marivirga harenae]
MHKFQDLDIWKRGSDLGESVYNVSAHFPSEVKFGLTSQLRRSAVSIPSNISKGAGRNSNKEFNHILGMSLGSLAEVQTQIVLASKFKFITEKNKNQLVEEIEVLRRMMYSFHQKVFV